MTRVLMVIAGPDEGKSFQLDKEQSVSVGRGAASDFQINDPFISRVHFYVKAQGEQTILNDAGSKGGLAVNGQTVAEHELEIGDVIYLGETHIRYQSSDSPIDAQFGSTFSERVFQPNELTTYGFGDANVRLENLSILPHMISESRSDKDLAAGLVKLLLESIPNANVVSVAEYESTQRKSDSTLAFEKPKMMQSGSRDGSSVRPSRRLVDRAFRDGESVLHVWSEMAAESLYTQSGQEDWAFCTPIPGDACEGWFLYVAGKLPFQSESAVTSKQLLGNLRFTELVGQFIGAIRQVRVLQDQQSIMRQFFSPRVVDTFSGPQTEDVLRPQEGTVSVLFCDVRGFSQAVERSAEQLPQFLDRVSEALGVMTRSVMRNHGVIADFQGDSVLAFWGWPEPLEDGPLAACRTALAIQRHFRQANRDEKHKLCGFDVGIGIGYGRAITGKIGTAEQAKVGVFGSVVNLASRLEGMTKVFNAGILMDEATADFARKHLPRSEGRCRTLGRVKPLGMHSTVTVTELRPPWGQENTITDAQIDNHEEAVALFCEGKWAEAMRAFEQSPPHDKVGDLLVRHIRQHNDQPPDDWDGTINLREK